MRARGPVVAALVAGLVTSAASIGAVGATGSDDAPGEAYTWGNVEIVGGGFVPGIEYNRTEPGLVYARTDIGGAYRLDTASGRWIPLLDHVGWDDWGHTGVLSLATDPVDPDRVYVAAGAYTNGWDPNTGAVLRSTDRGETWTASPLPFGVGGNMPGRGMGERLVVDPNDNDVLYLGAESGNGLWRSVDAGVTWARVTSMPNPGTYVQKPGDAYQGDVQGVVWVVVDPDSGTSGHVSQTVYVGVADPDHPVYRSTDAGATWEPVPGAPAGFIPHKGVLDEVGDRLYVATSDTGGPYDGAKGEVWRLDTASGAWTDISPVPGGTSDAYFGYSGLTIDRQHPDTLMVAAQVSWWPDAMFFRSTDAGATWSRIWDWAGYPNRTLRYTQDISGAPWLSFGATPAPPEVSPKLGWMTEAFEIDPFDSDRALYGTGATIYGIDDLTAWDDGGTVDISVAARGIEETAVLDLAAPPGPVELFSALGDIGGFRHDDVTTVPTMMFASPGHTTTTSLDFAELKPGTVVRVGSGAEGVAHLGVSTSGGASWWAGQDVPGVTGGGTVAVSADGARVLWSPEGAGVHVSTTFGSSWTAATGVPTGARVEADRVDPLRFYAFAAGVFYVSDDGGQSFAASPATGLPKEGNARFAAVPGHAGDIWLAGGAADAAYGLWRSTDGGSSFARVADIDEGDTVGFGKAAPGRSYPAVYTSAQVAGVRGIFRSDDAGATWTRINDDEHQWAWTGSAITGDPDVYGRVYVGTNGRGVILGEATGPAPTQDPTDEPTDDPSPADAACTVRYTVSGWPSGFTATIRITNDADVTRSGWTLRFALPAGQQIAQSWSAQVRQVGPDVTVASAPWNSVLAPGGSTELGFLATHEGVHTSPASFTLDGDVCRMAD